MILAIYNSFITPFQFSFEYVQYLLTQQPLSTVESVIDIIYMVDIAVGFMTSYYESSTGDEVTKPKLIAKKYLTSDFTIDFLSTVPFEPIWVVLLGLGEPGHTTMLVFKVFKLLKVFRLRKVFQMIRNLKSSKETKAGLQIAFYTFLLVIYTHVVACIMWYMMKTGKKWVPAVDMGSLATRVQLKPADLNEPWAGTAEQDLDPYSRFVYQYLTVWYNSAIAFMLVEVNARTHTQMVVMVLIYVTNAVVNAVLFGVFVEQFQVIRKRESDFQEKIDTSNLVMREIRLDKEIKTQIRAYFFKIRGLKHQLKGQKAFMSNISPELQTDTKSKIFTQALLESRSFIALKLLGRTKFKALKRQSK